MDAMECPCIFSRPLLEVLAARAEGRERCNGWQSGDFSVEAGTRDR